MMRKLLVAAMLATAFGAGFAALAAPAAALSGEVCVGDAVECTPFGDAATNVGIACVSNDLTQPASTYVAVCV